VQIFTETIKDYKIARTKDGAANATINRELAALRRIFSLGLCIEYSKIVVVQK
jgi:hypothetical protein